MERGPVAGTFLVFSDYNEFLQTKDGVYHRSKDAVKLGAHVIRIIGWGTENNEDYWLIANSYGKSIGGKDLPGKGLFKIRRGNNECNLEQTVMAGIFE